MWEYTIVFEEYVIDVVAHSLCFFKALAAIPSLWDFQTLNHELILTIIILAFIVYQVQVPRGSKNAKISNFSLSCI